MLRSGIIASGTKALGQAMDVDEINFVNIKAPSIGIFDFGVRGAGS